MAEPGHGKVVLTLEEYRLSRKISKNKIVQGAMLATNMASTCCNPKGMALATGTRPSKR